jgi:antitoxin VapB
MAALNIRDPEVHELARQLAARTGTTITEAVRRALREGLRRTKPDHQESPAARRQRIESILASYRSLPTADERSADEILGYNDRGHFD